MNEMEHLSQKCGGVEAGMHGFVPHCTLLYNTSLLPLDDDDGICDGKVDERQRRQEGETLLRECIQAYQQQGLYDRFSISQLLEWQDGGNSLRGT